MASVRCGLRRDGRKMRNRIGWLLAASIALAGIAGSVASEEARAATCTSAQLIPNVADLRVVQGAPLKLSGSAPLDRLARGKTTIVRAYLTHPTTCTLDRRQAINPVSATLDVKVDGVSVGPPLSNRGTLSGTLSATQQVFSTADPYFVVPASYLTPDSSSSFEVTFALSLTYNRTGATSQTNITGATTAGATVDRRTNALRVLVVPLGDATSATVQWSPAAYSTLQNLMTNTGRAFPVPDGVTESLASASASGGIRYVVSGTLLDVKALGLYQTKQGATRFCANAAKWATSQVTSGPFAGKTLKGELQERLSSYNLQNTPPADVAIGVADGAITWKSTDGVIGGCDDGRAATPDLLKKTPGGVAWVRVDTSGSFPSPLQMELFHTFGIVDPSLRPSFHSLGVEADGLAPNKGYNALLEKLIAAGTGAGLLGVNDHSIMNYDTSSIPYRPDNTNVEPRDWMDALCNFGGLESATATPFATCTVSTAIGTDAGIGAGNAMYHIVGQLSAAGLVTVTGAKVATGDEESGLGPEASPLHLVLCEGPCGVAANTRDVPLALTSTTPIDDDHTGEPTGPSPAGDTFSALVSRENYTCAELRLNGVTKFGACADDPAPDVVSTAVSTPGSVLRSFPMPVVGNGRGVAFDGTHLYTTHSSGNNVYKLTTIGTHVSTIDIGTTIAGIAFNPSTGKFYGGDYTGNGNIYEIDMSNGAKTTLFSFNEPDDCLFSKNFIDGLEYRPTANNLAVSGDACNTVFIKNFAGVTQSSFTVTRNSGVTTDGVDGMWLAFLTQGDTPYSELQRVSSTGVPIGQRVILSDHLAEDLAYDSVTFAPACAVWTNEATFVLGLPPKIRAIAVPCGTSGGDVAAVKTTNAEFVTLYAVCGSQADATNSEVEKFSLGTYAVDDDTGEIGIVPFTDDRFCANATIIAEASNGWATTGLTDAQGAAPTNASPQPPTVSISAPLNGSLFRIGDTIRFEGNATDAEDGTDLTLEWSDDKSPPVAGGTESSFERKVPSDATLGDHVITFKATDSSPTSSSAQVTIRIAPRICSSTSGCR
jgi:hypothetical protein